jgi:hypothetical protein
MKNFLVAAAIGAALATPSFAMAQAAPTASKAPAGMAAPMATLACRPIAVGEKTNASMGTVALICRKLNTARIEAAMTQLQQASAKMAAADKPTHDAATSSIISEFHFPQYPGEYPSGEY